MYEQKRTKQNRIGVAKYSCSKVSGSSELPWFVEKYFFSFFSCILRVLDDWYLERTHDS